MIDGLLFLLTDINDWIILVFVQRVASNINYFDASFANGCMEVEMIFAPEDDDDEDGLDFF